MQGTKATRHRGTKEYKAIGKEAIGKEEYNLNAIQSTRQRGNTGR